MEIDRFDRMEKDYNLLYDFVANLAMRSDTGLAYEEIDCVYAEAATLIKNIRRVCRNI